MQIGTREAAILAKLVELHVDSGRPVSSRQISRGSRLGLSAATIRMVMAELEESGHLERPHTSAGGVPTDLGYRRYIEGSRLPSELDVELKKRLETELLAVRRDPREGLGWAAELLAELTEEAGVAVQPLDNDPVVEAVSLVPLNEHRVLAVLVSASGNVDRRVVELDEAMTRTQLQDVANYLSFNFQGWAVGAASEQLTLMLSDDVGPLRRRAAQLGLVVFSASAAAHADVLYRGTERLVETPDFAEVERVRSLLGLLERKQELVTALRDLCEDDGPQVLIGNESDLTASGHLGMVVTVVRNGATRLGVIGVVGPNRMDYLRIVPLVDCLGASLNRMLESEGTINA